MAQKVNPVDPAGRYSLMNWGHGPLK